MRVSVNVNFEAANAEEAAEAVKDMNLPEGASVATMVSETLADVSGMVAKRGVIAPPPLLTEPPEEES